ncbi:MAG: bifunctional isocitrate dehydrogenase kinase/phosphatase [Thermoanaerobaculia bacterium]
MTTSAAAVRGADVIQHSFDEFQTRFRAITRRAKERFESRDWDGIRRDTVKRLGLQPQAVAETFEALQDQIGEQISDRELWPSMKEAYSLAILGRNDFEVAQTFFNSLTRRVFPHVGVDPRIDFISDDFPLPYRGWEMASTRLYAVRQVDSGVLRRILEDAAFRVAFSDLYGDARMAADRLQRDIDLAFGSETIEALDILRPVFIRNKAAYIIGRVRRGERVMPLVIAILNRPGGLRVDAVLTREEDVSIAFSFARWYFHADIDSPRQVIGFLHSILPRKRIGELYLSLGYNKHGKTEFYRDLMKDIAASEEPFIVAPGQPGLVMSVFTLPSFPFVFKVIKDFFPPSKHVTREDVIQKYREVMRHDRVGRLVDFQEFEHLTFRQERFSEELLEELLQVASQTVSLSGEDVVIRHLYIGRRVTPLDIYVNEASTQEARAAVIDWGESLKDLAAANVFAGDMLLKNFGVTRHKRVVFYDYDELCALSACRFRRIPPPRDDFEAMASEPWFSVADEDVFPEEMRSFLGLRGDLEEVFLKHHSDLFDAAYWRRMQARIDKGEIIDIYPYNSDQRLRAEPSAPSSGASWG